MLNLIIIIIIIVIIIIIIVVVVIVIIIKEAFSRIISLWGRLDIVCNNAAVLDEDDLNKTLNTNLNW